MKLCDHDLCDREAEADGWCNYHHETYTFQSADGSRRCIVCHLHPDTCTCVSSSPVRAILGLAAAATPKPATPDDD